LTSKMRGAGSDGGVAGAAQAASAATSDVAESKAAAMGRRASDPTVHETSRMDGL